MVNSGEAANKQPLRNQTLLRNMFTWTTYIITNLKHACVQHKKRALQALSASKGHRPTATFFIIVLSPRNAPFVEIV